MPFTVSYTNELPSTTAEYTSFLSTRSFNTSQLNTLVNQQLQSIIDSTESNNITFPYKTFQNSTSYRLDIATESTINFFRSNRVEESSVRSVINSRNAFSAFSTISSSRASNNTITFTNTIGNFSFSATDGETRTYIYSDGGYTSGKSREITASSFWERYRETIGVNSPTESFSAFSTELRSYFSSTFEEQSRTFTSTYSELLGILNSTVVNSTGGSTVENSTSTNTQGNSNETINAGPTSNLFLYRHNSLPTSTSVYSTLYSTNGFNTATVTVWLSSVITQSGATLASSYTEEQTEILSAPTFSSTSETTLSYSFLSITGTGTQSTSSSYTRETTTSSFRTLSTSAGLDYGPPSIYENDIYIYAATLAGPDEAIFNSRFSGNEYNLLKNFSTSSLINATDYDGSEFAQSLYSWAKTVDNSTEGLGTTTLTIDSFSEETQTLEVSSTATLQRKTIASYNDIISASSTVLNGPTSCITTTTSTFIVSIRTTTTQTFQEGRGTSLGTRFDVGSTTSIISPFFDGSANITTNIYVSQNTFFEDFIVTVSPVSNSYVFRQSSSSNSGGTFVESNSFFEDASVIVNNARPKIISANFVGWFSTRKSENVGYSYYLNPNQLNTNSVLTNVGGAGETVFYPFRGSVAENILGINAYPITTSTIGAGASWSYSYSDGTLLVSKSTGTASLSVITYTFNNSPSFNPENFFLTQTITRGAITNFPAQLGNTFGGLNQWGISTFVEKSQGRGFLLTQDNGSTTSSFDGIVSARENSEISTNQIAEWPATAVNLVRTINEGTWNMTAASSPIYPVTPDRLVTTATVATNYSAI